MSFSKIKLVLCDLDGTLLNSKKEVPAEFNDICKQLKQRGVLVGIATGRSFSSIERDFPELAHTSAIIVEGGSCAFYRGKVIHEAVIDEKLAHQFIGAARKINGVTPIICHQACAYANYIDNPDVIKQLETYYPRYELVNNIDSYASGSIKITIYDPVDANTNSYPEVEYMNKYLSVTVGASDWVDCCVNGVNKGKALSELMDYLNITSDEVMIFGDYLNDISMLEKVKYSVAMEDAHPDVKELCNYSCASNDENGVILKLKEIFNL